MFVRRPKNSALVKSLIRWDIEVAALLKERSRPARVAPNKPAKRSAASTIRVVSRVRNSPMATNANDQERSEDINPAPTGITDIKNDGEMTHSSPHNEISLPSLLTTTLKSTDPQDIKDYLTRPVEIFHGKWSSATTSPIATFQLPYDILNTGTMIGPKMQGFLAFRATLILRVQLNANRFQQGRLILHWVPQSVQEADNPALWSCWKGAMTQHRNVQLDANCDTEGILEIPYLSQSLAYDLGDGYGKMGIAYLSIYSPLAYASGSSEAEITVWASWKDIELHTPTMVSTFVPQSGKGGKLKKTPQEQERDASGKGPISSIAGAVSGAAKSLQKVPLLSSVAGTVGWFSDIVGGVATAFGWSAPANVEPASRMRMDNMPYHNNCDGMSNPYFSSLFAKNSVALLPSLGGTDIMETNLNYLLTRPSYFTNFSWTTSSTSGTALYAANVGPSFYYQGNSDSYNAGANQVLWSNVTPLTFFSSFFRYWRGSIKLTFKFVKTEFHTGRLVLCYAPNYNSTTPTLLNSSFLMREVIDLRMGNEFSFIIPYASTKPYLYHSDTVGNVYLLVQNELVAPATVSSSIDIIMEVSAHDDFEVAAPCDSKYINPYKPNTFSAQGGCGSKLRALRETPPSYVWEDEEQDCPEWEPPIWMPFRAEAGGPEEGENPCSISDGFETIGGGKVVTDNHASAVYCIGEKVLSVLSLMKRRCELRMASTPTAKFQWMPWSRQWGVYNSTTGYVAPTWGGDYFNNIAVCFGFIRGGIRVYVHDWQQNSTGAYEAALWGTPKVGSADLLMDGSINNIPYTQNSLNVHYSNIIGGLEVQVPMYHRFHCMFGARDYGTQDTSFYRQDYRLQVINAANYGNVSVGRAVADDFQMGCFVSVPPMYTNSV